MWYLVSLSPPENRMLRFVAQRDALHVLAGVVRLVLESTGTVSWQERTVRISPLPSLPMTVRGRRAVLNAMVSVVPEAVASITLDWSGPVTDDVGGAAVDRVREVLAPPIQRSRCGVDVVLRTAARVHSGGNADGGHARSRRT